MLAIQVENLGKSTLVGHNHARAESYTALRDVLARNANNLARKTRDRLRGRQILQGDVVEEFWALKDVSFEIQPGDRVGRNGAILGMGRKEIQTVGWARAIAVPNKPIGGVLRSKNAPMAAGPIRTTHKGTSVPAIGQADVAIAGFTSLRDTGSKPVHGLYLR